MRFAQRHRALLAYLLLAAALFFSLNAVQSNGTDKLYQTQLASCVRGNKLRAQINKSFPVLATNVQVLDSFLRSAETARKANFKSTHLPEDKKAAEAYGKLARKLEGGASFETVNLVNCNVVINKP